jgi:hypothetical protein
LLTVAAASVGSAEGQDLAMPASVALPSEGLSPREAPAEKAERAQKAAHWETVEDGPAAIDFEVNLDQGPFAAQDTGWTWQLMPDGLMYRSYLAGPRESRFASQWVRDQDRGWLWDIALGGRVAILRYGTEDPLMPQGWEIDIEGAAFPRLAIEEDCDMVSADFRFGVPLTHRRGRWETKFGYYHLSSHLGDEFKSAHPWIERINFSRDVLVLGAACYPGCDVRLYAEAGWAFYVDGGTEPWEFQVGAEYSPLGPTGIAGAPFLAVNGHLRQEVDFGGALTVQAGWQWRGRSGHLMRAGLEYFNGQSEQYQFFHDHEQLVGMGVWYDY